MIVFLCSEADQERKKDQVSNKTLVLILCRENSQDAKRDQNNIFMKAAQF